MHCKCIFICKYTRWGCSCFNENTQVVMWSKDLRPGTNQQHGTGPYPRWYIARGPKENMTQQGTAGSFNELMEECLCTAPAIKNRPSRWNQMPKDQGKKAALVIFLGGQMMKKARLRDLMRKFPKQLMGSSSQTSYNCTGSRAQCCGPLLWWGTRGLL